MTLETVYAEFNARLSPFGRVVIAGGAVRDTLLGKSPKDWDIFCLPQGRWDFNAVKAGVLPVLADLSKVKPVVDWHNSEPYLVATVKWNEAEVQVLVNPSQTTEKLIGTFDWNVCLFGFDGDYFNGEALDNIGVGKSLRLQKVTFPLSTLRRGFRFSERFKMKLERDDLLALCRKIVSNADAKNDVSPQGNEPDMPALAANALVEDAHA